MGGFAPPPPISEAGLHVKAFQAPGEAPRPLGCQCGGVTEVPTPRPRLMISSRSPPSPSSVLWGPANHGRGSKPA